MKGITSFGVLLALVLFSHLPSPAEGQATCQTSFLTRFVQCVTNNTLNSQHFLWLTRDGQMGSQPPDLSTFTQQTCAQEDTLSACFKMVVGQYNSSTRCNDDDKNAIRQFHKNVIVNLDKKCAHPCRDELIPSLAECFTNWGVNASLFLSNVTMPRHSMLGDTDNETDLFCQNGDEILQCMRMKTEMCPETPDILLSAGLDLDVLNNTVLLLCNNTELYLQGARCSVNQSVVEEDCRRTLMQELSEVEAEFQAMNIEKATFITTVCRVRLDHIRCDLNALNGRDEDSKCPDEVVGLRREQECSLLPVGCAAEFQARVTDMCDPIRFLRDKRKLMEGSKIAQTSGGQNRIQDLNLFVVAIMTIFVVTLAR